MWSESLEQSTSRSPLDVLDGKMLDEEVALGGNADLEAAWACSKPIIMQRYRKACRRKGVPRCIRVQSRGREEMIGVSWMMNQRVPTERLARSTVLVQQTATTHSRLTRTLALSNLGDSGRHICLSSTASFTTVCRGDIPSKGLAGPVLQPCQGGTGLGSVGFFSYCTLSMGSCREPHHNP